MQERNSRRAFIKQVALLGTAAAAGLILPGCDKPEKTANAAPAVIKKRSGQHEKTIREYEIGASGLSLGQPLTGFQGVLRGVPNFVGTGSGLMGDAGA